MIGKRKRLKFVQCNRSLNDTIHFSHYKVDIQLTRATTNQINAQHKIDVRTGAFISFNLTVMFLLHATKTFYRRT